MGKNVQTALSRVRLLSLGTFINGCSYAWLYKNLFALGKCF